jgi:hypothetical protein
MVGTHGRAKHQAARSERRREQDPTIPLKDMTLMTKDFP